MCACKPSSKETQEKQKLTTRELKKRKYFCEIPFSIIEEGALFWNASNRSSNEKTGFVPETEEITSYEEKQNNAKKHGVNVWNNSVFIRAVIDVSQRVKKPHFENWAANASNKASLASGAIHGFKCSF